jgi:alpha-glucosidase (family GH31 glycosyl hydrolase)
MSLLNAFEDPIRIEVYPDATGSATGLLYLDDGLSNQYENGAYTVVEYSFDGTLLTVSKAVEDAAYFKASNKIIEEIVILNVTQYPTSVVNTWINNTPYPD